MMMMMMMGPRPLLIGEGLVAIITPLPTRVNMLSLIAVGQTVFAYVRKSARKLNPSGSAFPGHSWSPKVTRISRIT